MQAELATVDRDRAIEELRTIFDQQTRWVKIHAAEALLWHGENDRVMRGIASEININQPQYRIGLWRVMAKATKDQSSSKKYTTRILNAFLDTAGPDRLHAVESLAKLNYKIPDEHYAAFVTAADSTDSSLAVYSRWLLIRNGKKRHTDRMIESLKSQDETVRLQTAFCIGKLAELSTNQLNSLRQVSEKEPKESAAYIYMQCALLQQLTDVDEKKVLHDQLVEMLKSPDSPNPQISLYPIVTTLADLGTVDDVPILTALLNHSNDDVRLAAANALLRIDRRTPIRLSVLDWVVIGAYAIGMLAVGWYFSKRSQTTDDYLLGGRNMSPWQVGLSLFATLLSTLTYLATPGEMISNGPMILGGMLAFPLVIWVVGWLMIPIFMKIRATTAYEILELRLGLSIRLLGTFFFLLLRLFWMAVIIYATVNLVLVPLLGLTQSATPWICIVLSVITVIYTSMGGLRAVVLTDVVQTFILLGGAILTIAIVSIHFGSVTAWWPSQWDPNWAPLHIGFSPGAKRSIAAAMLALFVWYVCTSGSDQMAVQRYLATSDVRAARRMFTISIGVSVFATILLGTLGFALLAYFRANPLLLRDGQTISNDADMLFPQFITAVMPVGISGLVIAGILAAAMSSLSSGVSSSCCVITVDLIDRFRSRRLTEKEHVKLIRWVSWGIGAMVVVLSFMAAFVEGNLLDVTYKVVNLLVVPLFILFFMAIYLPWATIFGTWSAAIASTTFAIGIAYYQWFGLGVLWIMPISLLSGIIVGSVVSMLPISRRVTPLSTLLESLPE